MQQSSDKSGAVSTAEAKQMVKRIFTVAELLTRQNTQPPEKYAENDRKKHTSREQRYRENSGQ